ncbi:hypothetical protein QR680_014786 [Steinernema hermaphroditum]|uniref:Uncharacterized protein n=1 Tax=Steinernema hermaphroditum TaxID=289476 RepID=A0AA39IA31_9BILA|nr:hypothetical protein QR680_014786 [Steinernema hermaphroditum]
MKLLFPGLLLFCVAHEVYSNGYCFAPSVNKNGLVRSNSVSDIRGFKSSFDEYRKKAGDLIDFIMNSPLNLIPGAPRIFSIFNWAVTTIGLKDSLSSQLGQMTSDVALHEVMREISKNRAESHLDRMADYVELEKVKSALKDVMRSMKDQRERDVYCRFCEKKKFTAILEAVHNRYTAVKNGLLEGYLKKTEYGIKQLNDMRLYLQKMAYVLAQAGNFCNEMTTNPKDEKLRLQKRTELAEALRTILQDLDEWETIRARDAYKSPNMVPFVKKYLGGFMDILEYKNKTIKAEESGKQLADVAVKASEYVGKYLNITVSIVFVENAEPQGKDDYVTKNMELLSRYMVIPMGKCTAFVFVINTKYHREFASTTGMLRYDPFKYFLDGGDFSVLEINKKAMFREAFKKRLEYDEDYKFFTIVREKYKIPEKLFGYRREQNPMQLYGVSHLSGRGKISMYHVFGIKYEV